MTRAELSPRHCRPLSRSVRGQRRRQAPAPAHISRLPGRTLGDDHHKEINVGPVSDQARAAAWPGVLTYIIITNKPRPDTPHCSSHWLDDITCPDTSSLAQFNAGYFTTKCGCLNTAHSLHRRPIFCLVTVCDRLREAAKMFLF
mgnify:FL=1